MNTFGSSSLQFPLCDPRSVITNRARFQRDEVPLLHKVNTFYCPTGFEAAKGWILLPRKEFILLDRFSTALQLHISDTIVLKNLSIVQAQCVTRGLVADVNALYLVEITDGRGILYNRWFQFPINAQYNVRSPAYPQLYYSSSINSGTAWTWSAMLEDIWTRMSVFLGTYPGLPSTPSGTPENWYFTGVSAWQALCDILSHLGMAVACDLTQNAPYTIIEVGADDAAFDALLTKYANRLEDDLEWLDTGSGRAPKTIVVYFRYRDEQYGQEETVRRDSPQWVSNSLYSVSVAAPAAFTSAVGTHFLHDDFTVRRNIDGTALTADINTANTIATERASQYFQADTNAGYMYRVYTGALPFTAGSLVDCVQWSQNRRGWRTTISRGTCDQT